MSPAGGAFPVASAVIFGGGASDRSLPESPKGKETWALAEQ